MTKDEFIRIMFVYFALVVVGAARCVSKNKSGVVEWIAFLGGAYICIQAAHLVPIL